MPFSALLRHPKQVTAKLDEAGSVRLTRRDKDDLVLAKADSQDAASCGVIITVQLLAALVAEDVPAKTLARAIAHACPWTRFLPDDDLNELIDEFIQTALACGQISQFQPLAVLLHAWRSTAAINADPHLSRVLKEPLSGEDFGPVEPPR
jgi:hypothetical protein